MVKTIKNNYLYIIETEEEFGLERFFDTRLVAYSKLEKYQAFPADV